MAGLPEEEAPPRSALGVVRDVVLSLTHMVEDSADLVSATMREELTRFRVDVERDAMSAIAVLAGASLLTAGLAIYLRELVGSWALSLCLFGAFYLGIAVALQKRSK